MIKNLILLGSILTLSCATPPASEIAETYDSLDYIIDTPTPTYLFGFRIDSFDVVTGQVKWNQNLSELLDPYAVSREMIFEIANVSKGVFDLRKLKAGYPYTIIHTRDSLRKARQFIFEPDPATYIIFNFVDSMYVQKVDREIERSTEEIYAVIETSVYEAVLKQNSSPLLVNKLVDVFAWQVDFFRIQKGDYFKVIYEVERVNGEIMNIGKIMAANFNHFGKNYYAFHYDHGGQEDYFDEQGNSLRKTFLRSPLNYSRISSRYNPKRFHPVLKTYRAHLGTDYAAPVGTPIRSVGEGVVLEATYGDANGNYVKIKHNSNYATQYLHMSKIASGIRPGVRVSQGQTIGFVGATGLANGPHLCFRFWKNGKQVDALKVDLPPSEPISASKKVDFLHTKNVYLNQLAQIQDLKENLKASTITN